VSVGGERRMWSSESSREGSAAPSAPSAGSTSIEYRLAISTKLTTIIRSDSALPGHDRGPARTYTVWVIIYYLLFDRRKIIQLDHLFT